ncbi:MAG: twin-arginine translocase TatA/TatE family subunit [Candidatus Marinimicrobia bacterium]|jgi:sec-independent protein translocase protein TatA|nr:twin-arginine translocase TatA/TatE family subunit [Candidatus Neomarinimicrobiota bacterium]MBH82262.1 twin-arginine translocase TatA/TatE family subunit [Candidatus Neomarinimicrobiota bacterium]MCS5646725.1 twin-arginine translocase TatA/TatE family subunit [Candidatus Neomarinimicrobiota bacterium]MEC7735943.1 twin-arginine translocase TatA/TatE family subunit [Candidatus Neomarinimicrobiota bacterium]MEC7745667.1 twin-arginine translocase TatA/TatE family subunit [Candidatus Neomarinimi|tara:strand:- start:1291 stop:1497 length:207 start_codon:yes stop_codon:yes gene_type:complete
MFNLGTGELLLIFLVILLLFGAKRLPELARGLGKGINEFKDAVETGKQEIMDAKDGVDLEGDSKKEKE